MSIVETSHLSKTYRSGLFGKTKIVALRDVSLSVNAGEVFGLLGPNGAGKTTFVKILLSIAFPTSGSGTILARPLKDIRIREKIGYLPENHRYPSFLPAIETLLLFGKLHGLENRTLKEKARSLLQLVGLKDWMHTKLKKFSKGMLQRLGMAQALLNDPEILFLDEPTDGVDPIGRKEIRDILRELRSRGTTIFLNSHILSEVEMICDRVAILHKGEVLKVDSVETITRKQLEYEFTAESNVPDELIENLRSSATNIQRDGSKLIITVTDKSQLNKLIDMIRERGIFIHSIMPRKSSLEDCFVQLIKSQKNS